MESLIMQTRLRRLISIMFIKMRKIKKADNKRNHKKHTIDLYDQVRKIFIALSPISDIDYVPTYDKSDESPYEYIDTTNIAELKSDESVEQRKKQKPQGLKILTPQQMLSRLPISVAQLKAGNNSEKRKNEIRQLLYSLYRSKKLSKSIYKHLISII